MQIHSVLKRGGVIVGYETMSSQGRHFHLGQPPRTHQAPPQARCPECQRYRGPGNEACTNCGAIPAPMPAAPVQAAPIPMPVPAQPWYRHAATAPTIGEQLDAAIAARATGRVGNFGPPPPPAPVAPPCPKVLLTFAAPSTLDAVVARQRQTGLRPPDPHAPLRAMDATRCERCHRQGCNCPPTAPKVLDLVAQRQAQRLAVHEQAAQTAGLPEIRRVVGMS